MIENNRISSWIVDAYQYFGFVITIDSILFKLTALLTMFSLAWFTYSLSRYVLNSKMSGLVLSSKNQLDDELHKKRFFSTSRAHHSGCFDLPA